MTFFLTVAFIVPHNTLYKRKLGRVKEMFYINEGLYKKLYLHLFNAVTDALERMNRLDYASAEYILKKAQQDCEEIYISEED